MSLLDFFKPKNNALDNELARINRQLFPNGEKDREALATKLEQILNNQIGRQEAKNIIVRSAAISFVSKDFTIERLRQHLAGYCLHYFDETALKNFYILLNDTFRTPKERDWVNIIPKNIAQIMVAQIESNPQACQANELDGAIGEFGLTPSNPVPVYGIPNSDVYLGKLRTMDGMPITWNRAGSLNVANITHPVDSYKIFDSSNNQIANIYISPYHPRISQKAPNGFKIIL